VSLPGAREFSAFKGCNSRPQHACKKFLGVRATTSCPPPTRQSLPVVLVLHGAIHQQAGRKVIVYSVSGMPIDRVGSSHGGGLDTNAADMI